LLFTGPALHSDTPLFVVESELDAILMLDKGQDAVSIDSANHKLTDEDRDLLRSVKNITLMLDQDEAGHKAAKRLLAEIPSAKALLVFGGGKDVGELWNACAPSDQPRRIRYEVTGLTDWPELVVGVVIDTPPEASVVALDD